MDEKRAEAILVWMLKSHKNGNIEVKPNTITFTSVCDAWSKSGHPQAVDKIKHLIALMKELSAEGLKDIYPNAYTYHCLFTAIARSKDNDKAVQALQLLRDIQNDRKVETNTFIYNGILNACAYSTFGTDQDRITALKIAVLVVEEAIQYARKGDRLNVTYGNFFQACSALCEKREDERIKLEKLIEHMFQQCCKQGQVDSLLIKQLKGASSKSLFRKLLGKYQSLTIDALPQEWQKNVKGGHPGDLTRVDEAGRKFRMRGKR